MARVVMFVLNDVRRDARVLREAATLAAAGHAVTVVGRPAETTGGEIERELVGDVAVVRVPVPGRLRRRLLAAGGGRSRGAAAAAGSSPASPDRRRGGLAGLVGAVRSLGRAPILGSLVRGVEFLARWRLGILAWAAAAAAAAPGADVWHGHDLTGLAAADLAARRRGGRVVYDSHELYLEAGGIAGQPRWARAVLRRQERSWARRAARVITVNDGVAERLETRLGVTRPVVVMNAQPAWDPPDPLLDRLRPAAGVAPDTPLVLYHGGFLPDRGLPELIAAMRRPGLEAVHLAVMGWGPLEAEVRRLAASPELGGRVHVLPPVPPAELLEWVGAADLGAMPNQPRTLNERLTTPNKLFECLAAGVPVVSSDFPERRPIVVDDDGVVLGAVCDPTDPAAIGDAIREVLARSPADRAELRERCRRHARRHLTWETQAERLLAVYDGIVGRPAERQAGAAATGLGPVPQRLTIVLPTTGAFDSRTRRIAASIAGRGHDVLVIGRREPGLATHEALPGGGRLLRVEAGAAPPRPNVGRGPAWLLREGVRIARTARRTSIQARAARAVDRPADLYHAMGFLALPVTLDLAGQARAPFVYDARDLYAEGNNIARLPAPLRWAFARRERSWAGRAAAVLTVNEGLAGELERRLGIERPVVVRNGQVTWRPPADPPDRLRTILGLEPDQPILLYHGGFMRDRGLPQLVAAMRDPALATARLVLMGDGPARPEIEALASAPDVAGRVHLLPPVPPDELLTWIASADVGVMPNQPRTINERLSTPNKLFECLAAGVPVVSSDFPERRRVILDNPDGPLGAVCDPTDPTAIAAAVASLLALPPAEAAALRARCRAAARERYSWEAQLPALLGAYGRATGRAW